MNGRRLAHVVAASLAVLSTTACASAVVPPGAADTGAAEVPFTMQPPVPRGGLAGGFGLEHIERDTAGAYVCVLRRGDDLASLRARFSPRTQEAESPST